MDISEILRRSDTLHQQYAWSYAGFPRVTRSPAPLRDLSKQAAELETAASGANGEQRELLKNRRELYEREAVAVEEAIGAGVEAIAAGARFLDVRARRHAYVRYFARKGRTSRDPSLLEELMRETRVAVDDLKNLHQIAPGDMIAGFIKEGEEAAAMMERELKQVKKAKAEASDSDAHNAAASEANEHFERYRQQFASLPRLSRRPEQLERMVNRLSEVLSWMRGLNLQAGTDAATQLENNIRVVNQYRDSWANELQQVRDARAACQFEDLVSAFDNEVRLVTESYQKDFAGLDRKTRDLRVLSGLISRLDDIERMLHQQLRVRKSDVLSRRLAGARELRMSLSRVWDAILSAQSDSSVQSDTRLH